MHQITCTQYVTQYNKRYILSTFENIEIVALSKRRFNKLSNDTKFVPSVYSLLFNLYFTHYFVNYLRINLADKMYILLYWVTYFCIVHVESAGHSVGIINFI